MSTRSPWHSLARLGLVVLSTILVLFLALIVLQVELDLTGFKQPIEAMLTSWFEAPITIEELALQPSLRPTFTAVGVVLDATDWSPTPYLAQAEALEVQISLLPLLKKRVRIKNARAVDLTVRAFRPEATLESRPESSGFSWELQELGELEIDRIALFLEDRDLGDLGLQVDQVKLDVARSRPLDLTLRGRFEGEELSLAIGGPTLEFLLSGPTDLPLSAELGISDLEAGFEGNVSWTPEGVRFSLDARVESPGLAFVRLLTDTDLSEIEGFDLSTTISNRDDWIDVKEIDGRIGPTALRGKLSFGGQNPKPALEGRLALDRLDLGRWLASDDPHGSDPQPSTDFSLLEGLDATLDLAIGRLDGLPFEVTEIAASIGLTDGTLTAPMTFAATGIPVSTELTLDAVAGVPTVSLAGQVANVTVDQLRAWIDLDSRLDGSIAGARFDAFTRGHDLEELIDASTVEMHLQEIDLELSRGPGKPPVRLSLAETHLTHQTRQPLNITSSGRLLETPFDFELQTASPAQWKHQTSRPIDLRVRGGGGELILTGQTSRSQDSLALDFDFSLTGDRIRDLQDWLGFSGQAQAPYRVRGKLTTLGGSRRVEFEDSVLGRSRFQGEIAWEMEESTTPTRISLHAATLDLGQLAEVIHPDTQLKSEQDALGLDVPILPDRVHLRDIDLGLTVDRLLRETVDLTDIEASIRIRDGHLDRSPFSFTYGPSRFRGEIGLSLDQEIPRFYLSVKGGGDALREFLQGEDISDGFPIEARTISLEFDAQGRTLRQLLRSSQIFGEIEDVRFPIQVAVLEEPLQVALDSVRLSAPRNEPAVFEAVGRVEDQPLRARLESHFPARRRDPPGATAPFELNLEVASATVRVDGELQFPIEKSPTTFRIQVSGDDLASLSSVLGRDLPRRGPYRLQTTLARAQDSYALSDLALQIAESSVAGNMKYEVVEGRPTLTGTLSSPLIRSVDFLSEPVGAGELLNEGDSKGDVQTPSRGRTPELSLDFLRGFDASIRLDVRTLETFQGSTARLSASVEIDRGTVDVKLESMTEDSEPGELRLYLEPDGDEISAIVTARWSRRRYGIFSDLLSPGIASGAWSLDAGLSTRGSDYQELLAGLNGHIDFTDYPVGASATILDLWGGGLMDSVLPIFNLGQESLVNCTAGRFRVEQGIVTPEKLVLDTTRTRVVGKGSIDLPANRMKLKLKPRPKQRSLINLATPVVFGGRVTDPSVGVSAGGLATTAFRLSLWTVTVWRDIFRKPLPTDGSDVCFDPAPRPEF